MQRTASALLALPLTGCLVDHEFSDFETDSDASAGATSATSGQETEGATQGSADGPGQTSNASAGDDGDWPPNAGFDPVPDIGDGTLSDAMIVVAELPQGRMYLSFYAERPGYGIVGSFANAVANPEGVPPLWIPDTPSYDIGYNGVEQNEFGVILNDFTLADTTPLGPIVVDLVFKLRLYSDNLMCGTVDIDLPGSDRIDDAPVVVWQVEDILDPNPVFGCVEP